MYDIVSFLFVLFILINRYLNISILIHSLFRIIIIVLFMLGVVVGVCRGLQEVRRFLFY